MGYKENAQFYDEGQPTSRGIYKSNEDMTHHNQQPKFHSLPRNSSKHSNYSESIPENNHHHNNNKQPLYSNEVNEELSTVLRSRSHNESKMINKAIPTVHSNGVVGQQSTSSTSATRRKFLQESVI